MNATEAGSTGGFCCQPLVFKLAVQVLLRDATKVSAQPARASRLLRLR